jgi:hypothetical protein
MADSSQKDGIQLNIKFMEDVETPWVYANQTYVQVGPHDVVLTFCRIEASPSLRADDKTVPARPMVRVVLAKSQAADLLGAFKKAGIGQ